MPAQIEHVNFTVSNPAATAKWMDAVFGWKLRWEGDAIAGGHTKHVGTETQYVALYVPPEGASAQQDALRVNGGLNHVAVTVDDLDATEALVLTQGFKTSNHDDYDPGRRFYFHDADGIEFEVVSYV